MTYSNGDAPCYKPRGDEFPPKNQTARRSRIAKSMRPTYPLMYVMPSTMGSPLAAATACSARFADACISQGCQTLRCQLGYTATRVLSTGVLTNGLKNHHSVGVKMVTWTRLGVITFGDATKGTE